MNEGWFLSTTVLRIFGVLSTAGGVSSSVGCHLTIAEEEGSMRWHISASHHSNSAK